MEIYLVRHAEAAPGVPDELRELTPGGRAAAHALGERLRDDGVAPDAVLTSPLLRARQTGRALARQLGVEPVADERLAPGADAAAVRRAVTGLGATVVVVGHQPDCGQIAAELSGGEKPPFPPAGMAVIHLPE